ncbi:MAG: hypothetical protein Q8P60_11600 [Pseudorhodobacter sp.]|nr:hypothetical protein [Pseudorhodobacter sp.]
MRRSPFLAQIGELAIQGVKVIGQVVDLIKQATAGKARHFRKIAGLIGKDLRQ